MTKSVQIAAVYLRVSTKKQADGGTAISGQLKAINDLLSRENIHCYKVYTDEGKTGTNENRPALREMLAEAHGPNPPFNLILLWDVSRFDRHFQNWVNHVYTLRAKGINIRTVDSHLNLDDPMHEMMAMFTGLQAAQFSVTLSKNTRRGMNETIRHGFFPYGKAPFGYSLHKVPFSGVLKNKLVLNPDEAKIVKLIFDLTVNENMGAKNIAEYLNAEGYRHHRGRKFTFKAVLKMMRNEVYTGNLVGDKTILVNGQRVVNATENRVVTPNAHEAIIDDKTFKKALERIEERRNDTFHHRTVNSQFLFNGIAFCALCGAPITSTNGTGRWGGVHFYYTCRTRRMGGKKECSLPNRKQPYLDRILVGVIQTQILNPENVRAAIKQVNETFRDRTRKHAERLKDLEKDISSVKQKIDRTTDLITQYDSDAALLMPRLKTLNEERVALDVKYRQLQDAALQNVQIDGLEDLLANLSLVLGSSDSAKRKLFISMVVKRVDVYPDKVIIHYSNPIDPTKNSFVAPFAARVKNKKDPKTLPNDGVRFWVSYASPRGIEPLLRE